MILGVYFRCLFGIKIGPQKYPNIILGTVREKTLLIAAGTIRVLG